MTALQRIELETQVDDLKTQGFAVRRDISGQERFTRAAKMFGIFFGIALLTLFVPVLHFILPPLFLIAGGIFAWTTWMESSEVVEGQLICPNCKHQMTMNREAEEWPKVQRCGACSFMLRTYPVGHRAGQASAADDHATGNF